MEKRRVSFVMGMFLMGILLVGHGITGNYLLGYREDACEDSSDCVGDEVCCLFYEESYGICDLKDNCAGILQASRTEKEVQKTEKVTKAVDESKMLTNSVSAYRSPVGDSRNYSFSAGLILLLLAVLVFMWDTGRTIVNKKKK